MKKRVLTSMLLGFSIIYLMFSGTVSQAMISSSSMKNSASSVDFFVEEMDIIAGLDSAALIKLNLYGEVSPAKISSSALDNVLSWIFVLSDQQTYADYLLRRPFKAPDNATLILEIKKSLGAEGSLDEALVIAALFDAQYGLELHWAGAAATDAGNYLYVFSSGSDNTQIQTLTGEITSDITTGYTAAIDATEVANAPVKAVFVGEDLREGLSVRGIYFVDSDAITGTDTYTLSTDNIFGEDLDVYQSLGTIKYSILKFRFPYLINAISIDPIPQNVAPQISGKMDWHMQVPWRLRDITGNFEVVYEINLEDYASTPRVAVNMEYDQDLLNNDGILQMDYEVTNSGTETAENVTISYPLGPDFMDLIVNKPSLLKLKDDIIVEDSFEATVNATLNISIGGVWEPYVEDFYVNVPVLVFEGWYKNITDNTWVFWDNSTTNASVTYQYQEYEDPDLGGNGTVAVEANLLGSNGINTILWAVVQYYLDEIDLIAYLEAEDLEGLIAAYGEALWTGVEWAYLMIFSELYEEQTMFDPNYMDFHLTNRTVGPRGFERTEYFLETVIPEVLPGETIKLSWALENVTSQSMEFGVMRGEELADGSIKLITEGYNYYEMMQMILGFSDAAGPLAHGRPLSWYDESADQWISAGARFRYQDPQGFEYFGFSNGINFQLADDEAVLNTYVELNQTSYTVGDPVQVTGFIRNTGNLDAYNVNLYLFHGRLGGDWQIEDPDLFYAEEIGVIEQGTQYNFTVDVDANSFLGIHPVYAVVEFDSDYGQDPLPVYNFWDPNMTEEFEGAAQTHQIVLSNMAWGLLLPDTEARRPAFPQPVLDVETNVNIIIPDDAPWELEVEVIITNIGDAETHVTVHQYYNTTELDLLYQSTTKGAISNGTYLGMGYIRVEGITLGIDDSVTITMRWMFLTSDGCYLPGVEIIYDSRYENELGGEESTTTTMNNQAYNALQGSSQDSDADNWQDYGDSTATGSSAGADIYTGGEEKTRRVGSFNILFLTFGTLMVVSFGYFFRKRRK